MRGAGCRRENPKAQPRHSLCLKFRGFPLNLHKVYLVIADGVNSNRVLRLFLLLVNTFDTQGSMNILGPEMARATFPI